MPSEQPSLEAILARHDQSRDHLIPLLQEVQEHFRFLSPEAVQRLNAEVNLLLQQPELRDRVQKLDNVALSQTASQFGASLRSAFEQNGKIVKQANIKAE